MPTPPSRAWCVSLGIVLLSGLAGCSGGDGDREPPAEPPTTELVWDEGNWNEQNWQ